MATAQFFWINASLSQIYFICQKWLQFLVTLRQTLIYGQLDYFILREQNKNF